MLFWCLISLCPSKFVCSNNTIRTFYSCRMVSSCLVVHVMFYVLSHIHAFLSFSPIIKFVWVSFIWFLRCSTLSLTIILLKILISMKWKHLCIIYSLIHYITCRIWASAMLWLKPSFLYKNVDFWIQPQIFLRYPKLWLKNVLIIQLFVTLNLS